MLKHSRSSNELPEGEWASTIVNLWILLTLIEMSSLYIYYLNSSSGFTFYIVTNLNKLKL